MEGICDYPKDLRMSNHSVAFNEKTNKIYISGYCNGMNIIDIGNKEWQTFKDNAVCVPFLLNVIGTIHRIGGVDNSKHEVWDDEKNCFKELYDFKKKENICEISGGAAIYIASKQIILLIG
eukprot:88570_1